MLWFFYSILCALFLSTSDVFSKRALSVVDEYVVAWGRLAWSFPFVLLLFPFSKLPHITSNFFIALIALIPLEVVSIILYMKAIKASDLSITTPFLGLTPLFLLFTSFIMLGELPDKSGTIGIILVAVGVYLLNSKKSKKGLLAPIKAIPREKGSLLMIIVSFIYSITSNLGKIAAQNSSPLFFSMVYVILLPVILFPLAIVHAEPKKFKKAFTNPNFFLLGLSYSLMILFHFNAVVLVEVPYMISVKRTSLLFNIIYGKLIFREKEFSQRLIGGCIILAGVFLITLV